MTGHVLVITENGWCIQRSFYLYTNGLCVCIHITYIFFIYVLFFHNKKALFKKMVYEEIKTIDKRSTLIRELTLMGISDKN